MIIDVVPLTLHTQIIRFYNSEPPDFNRGYFLWTKVGFLDWLHELGLR